MTCSIDSSFACLPITALQTVNVGDRNIILAGQGSFLRVHDSNERELWRGIVFESECIHGIATNELVGDSRHSFAVVLLLYGASKACLVQLNLFLDLKSSADVLLVGSISPGRVCDIGDWILHGILVQDASDHVPKACFVTAHNEVRNLQRNEISQSTQGEFLVSLMASGPASILYSAYLKPLSNNHMIVAAGTVFGEIHVWSCHLASNKVWLCTKHYTLIGHLGSIFGVCISNEISQEKSRRRLLASCSDDRTIRIWDITDCNIKPELDVSRCLVKGLSRITTGFGNELVVNGTSELTVVWAHLSRIWGVVFLPSFKCDDNQILLFSRGEDGMCQIWELSLRCGEKSECSAQLRPVKNDRHHSGKNIWSMAYDLNVTFTGGADGAIVSRSYLTTGIEDQFSNSTSFSEVIAKLEGQFSSKPASAREPRALKQYLLVQSEILLATTDSGHLLQGLLDNNSLKTSWEVFYGTANTSLILLCHNALSGITFFSDRNVIMTVVSELGGQAARIVPLVDFTTPRVTWMYIAWTNAFAEPSGHEVCLLTTVRASAELLVAWVSIDQLRAHCHETRLVLPDTFAPTSALYHPTTRLLVVGSRAGAIALYHNVYRESSMAEGPIYIRHVHRFDSITSIIVLDSPSGQPGKANQPLHILTTGRDGTYAVHRIGALSMRPPKREDFETVHMLSAPFGPNIEGAYLMGNETHADCEIILYGFRSKNFVVWNESSQSELFSIDCGGAHRSWSYSPRVDIFAKTSGGSFVWTKAGSVHRYSRSKTDHMRVLDGGHGREIKAMAKYPRRYTNSNAGLIDATLIATGAEDTTIRVFAVSGPNNPSKSFRCIRVLKCHTTGLQHLHFSDCGKFLFSSAGCEELFVWRIRIDVPCIGIGVLLQDSLPKEEADSDARITSFDLKSVISDHSDGNRFLIAAAYSNGKVKLIQYLPNAVGSGRFEILSEFVEGQFCLTQLQMVENVSGPTYLLTSGTNGHLNMRSFASAYSFTPVAQTQRLHVHQSSVKALQVVRLTDQLRLVATGGDDNALVLTVFQDASLLDDRHHQNFRTLRIPKAHAAAITAVSVFQIAHQPAKTEAVLASTGNDQRIKVWRLTINKNVTPVLGSSAEGTSGEDVGSPALFKVEDIQVEMLAEDWTNVADAGDMTWMHFVSEGPDEVWECELLVVGVGMEMMRLRCQR